MKFFPKMFLCLVLMSSALFFAVGCRKSAPIQTYANTVATYEVEAPKMREAIIRAGNSLNWHMQDDGPNKLLATYKTGKHSATVSIPYDGKSYKINYASSYNLREKNGSIHPTYNTWVDRLNTRIMNELAMSK